MKKLTILTTDEFFSSVGIEKDSTTMKDINHYWGQFLTERKILFFAGIKELLENKKNNGCFLGVATSRTQEELKELEDLMQYIKYFDVVITSDKVDKPKPSPDSINLIVDEFNLDRSETIYIGDSESDSVALKNAEVLFGFASWENKNNIGYYDYLFESPKDIFSLCNDINKVN